MPAQAITIGRNAVSAWADTTKYTASPTAAPSPHSTPIGSRRWLPVTSSTRASPSNAAAAPATVSRRGRCPCRSQSQPTTSRMPRYSSSRATPTDSRATALK